MTDIHTLYAAPLSYYSGKIRAYLRWKQIPFEEKLASPQVFEEILIPRVGRLVMPVVITADDMCLQDTTEIIDYFEPRMPGASIYPDMPAQRLAALLLEFYGDEWLLIPAMYYRWAYNREWILQEWGRTQAPYASPDEARQLGLDISLFFRGPLLIALGVTEQSAQGIETSYEELLGELDAHFSVYPYLFGSKPSIGDYGLTAALYAHQYQDPWTSQHMKRNAPAVVDYVCRCEFPTAPLQGEFLPDDEVPETVLPILRRMMTEQMPHVSATVTAIEAWAAENPDTRELPRFVGCHEFQMGGGEEQRQMNTYAQWMLQRAHDYYTGLEGADKAVADKLLDQIGGEVFRDISIQTRVKLDNFKLVVV